jgi:hypothetical protein
MAGEQRRSTPIFRDVMDEPAVWDDDVVLANWLRLRLTADAAYPEAAEIPRRVSDELVDQLVGLGKIERVGRDRYRCRGVDFQRAQASAAARASAQARWGTHAPALPPLSDRSAPALRADSDRNATETETETETVDLEVLDVGKRARTDGRRTKVHGFTGPLGR